LNKSVTVIYFFANVIGALLTFYFAHGIVAFAKTEHRLYFDASDSFTFLGETWLIFLAALFLNGIWLVKALIDIFKHRNLQASAWFCIVVLLWVAAFVAVRLGSNLA
jgi:hypothetical protein